MTREEAIHLLVNATYSKEWQGNEKLQTAHNMAIKALEERPTGKWITTDMKGIYRCSECKMLSYLRSYNYCQNCGTKMEER